MSDFFYKHRVPTYLFLAWVGCVCSYVIYRVFGENPPDIGAGTVTALSAVLGLPTIAIGLYQWRSKDSNNDGKQD